ncbi:MAG: GNAT family N-acetyltransferase [Bacteroidetes bacterium]|nr:GNAT family N-acetyltransferase [Bacteroidota bacterium]
MSITIRPGEKADLPVVLSLIKELADYEQAPHEVEVTLAELENDFQVDCKAFNFLAAEDNGKMVGMALYFIKYSTWKGKCIYLDDIIVTQSHRGKGIGTQLFNNLILLAKEMKMRKLEWMVLDWNETAINFYQKYPSVFDHEWINCRLTEKEISRFEGLK